jgi:UDP-N-acetylmuramoyl-tripeptide--D-alanyl-D-alanine ligase
MSFFQNIGQKQRLVTSIIIGVPLTLLSFTAETEIGLLKWELIIKNEIEFLCELLCLTMDILQILVKHLEGFGGVAGVIEGKSEMYRHLSLNDKFVL